MLASDRYIENLSLKIFQIKMLDLLMKTDEFCNISMIKSYSPEWKTGPAREKKEGTGRGGTTDRAWTATPGQHLPQNGQQGPENRRL